MTFTVTTSAISSQDISVRYSTTDNSAVSPADYTAQSDILTTPAGTTSATVTLPTINDKVLEPTETFNITLSNPVNAIIADAAGVCTILNDDIQAVDILQRHKLIAWLVTLVILHYGAIRHCYDRYWTGSLDGQTSARIGSS